MSSTQTVTEDEFENETESNKNDVPIDHTFTHRALTIATPECVKKVSASLLHHIHLLHKPGRHRLSSIHENVNENRVLVLYTGGTIGMKNNEGVYSPEPHFLPSAIRELPPLNDKEYVEKHYFDCDIKPYCLPPVKGFNHRVTYWVVEYEPLLDSSDMTFDDWIRIAHDIKKSYQHYDGFVVLHGTDTLAYTACALSFMMEQLGKPVVVTGSQIPVAEVRSDGRENLIGALIVAGHLDIPEVCVYFNNKLLRGNRTTKLDNWGMDAFTSPNNTPLAVMDISISVNWENIFRSNEIATFNVADKLCRNVSILRIFPSIPIESVRAVLRPPTQGVVLQTYGSGNIPLRRTDIIDEIKAAVDRGCLVLNVSQCLKGRVNTSYATGKVLSNAGVIPGSDMTTEAALTKLAYVLSCDCSIEEKKLMLVQNIRGELTIQQVQALNELDIIPRLAKYLHISSSHETKLLKEALFTPLVSHAAHTNDTKLLESLRLSGANFANTDYNRRNALHVAAANANLESVQYLLQHGVSVHVRDADHENALQAAIQTKNLEIITTLRNAGAHLSAHSVRVGTELCLTASQEDIEGLRAWFAAGASPNEVDYDGRTALHVAVHRNLLEVAKFLCQNGANPLLFDNLGRRPMDEASDSAMKELLEETANKLSSDGSEHCC
ncbi:unnamed protein product [Bursaphelenchus okinawaensis]|uniref:asparaginase n=1 Tax=Bursaphelenchus okinawaensis TaxID=465554 RepID=A0A811LCZ5_9BILA|nr:unnamed protein product [Bursaphelenchus okinawaensis]CAG9121058.1 unnamed protein product [Bursaphelenchus okinawaensis]